MPIKVACTCGKKFSAADKLAGKTVKCPQCGSPLAIPGPSAQRAGADRSATRPAGNPPGKAGKAPANRGGMAGMLDEAGIKASPTGQHCPSCHQPLATQAVLCINCGYNLQLGRRLSTVAIAEAEEGSAESALQRASRLMAEEKQLQEQMLSAGAPWWVWLLLLVVIGVFIGASLVLQLPPLDVMVALGSLVVAFVIMGGCLIAACWIYDTIAQMLANNPVGVPVPALGNAVAILIVNTACNILFGFIFGMVIVALARGGPGSGLQILLMVLGFVPFAWLTTGTILKLMLRITMLRGLAVSAIYYLMLIILCAAVLTALFLLGVAIVIGGH